MENLIASLSMFYRISLSKGKGIIPLSREIEHVRNYLYIQQVRFQDLLSYDIQCNVDPELYSIVKITLQPLAENAIQHGIKPKLVPCKVIIAIEKEQDHLIIKVTDNGIGISPEKLERLREQLNGNTPTEGFGLYNVHKRLNLIYGPEYGLTLTSREGEWTCVTARIPAAQPEKEVLEHV